MTRPPQDIKQSNIFAVADFQRVSEAAGEPAPMYEPPDVTLEGVTYPLSKSQPICMPWSPDDSPYMSELHGWVLADFSQGIARSLGFGRSKAEG